jgi:RNA-directed DNA polymerase
MEGHGVSSAKGLGETLHAGSESLARVHMPDAREPGDLEGAPTSMVDEGHEREGNRHNRRQYAFEESDALVVPKKWPNSRVTPEEAMEGRSAANGNPSQRDTSRTQDGTDVHTHLARVGERAKKEKGERFGNLLSHIKLPLLLEAYEHLRPNKKSAAGIDGQTWSEYGENLDARLLDLQERVHRGSYHPLPERRVHIPKGDGHTRPIGIPSNEDKVLQQAVRMLLEPIYESGEFLGFSYGFRPGRSAHDALEALRIAIVARPTNWVLDADIQQFFDTIDHGWMQKFLEHRIADTRLVRLLMKWLHAGVMEERRLYEAKAGTPQGGIISPLLANIYLTYALDQWVHQWRRRHARGEVYIVRYADDFVMGFEQEEDARAMDTALAERLAKFGLTLHPDKTRVIRFGRFAQQSSVEDGLRKPETFDFLGFTHICARRRGRGKFLLLRHTSRKKRRAKLGAIREEIARAKHKPPAEQYRWLCAVLRGHYNYYGVPGNMRRMAGVREQIREHWHRTLQRRSQRASWTNAQRTRFDRRYPLPPPRLTHPYVIPTRRDPPTQGRSPVREIRTPGSVRGAPR